VVLREPELPVSGRGHDQCARQGGQHLGQAGAQVVRQQARQIQQVLQADFSRQKRSAAAEGSHQPETNGNF